MAAPKTTEQNYLCVEEMEHPDVTGSAESGLFVSGKKQNKHEAVEQQVCKCIEHDRAFTVLVKLAVSDV